VTDCKEAASRGCLLPLGLQALFCARAACTVTLEVGARAEPRCQATGAIQRLAEASGCAAAQRAAGLMVALTQHGRSRCRHPASGRT